MTTPDHGLRKVQKLLTLILTELDRVRRRIGVPYTIYGGTATGAIRHGGFIPWDDDIDVMMTRADHECFLAEAPALLDDRSRLDNMRTRDDFSFVLTKMVMLGTPLIPKVDRDSKYWIPFFLDILSLDEVPDDDKVFQEMSCQSWLWGRLLLLQGTSRPHLTNTLVRKKALIFSATTLAHLGLKAVRATPASLQARWERAVRRYKGTGAGVYTSFTMCDPQNWIACEEESFPIRDVPFGDITVMIQNEYNALLRRGYDDYMQLPPPEKRCNHEVAVIDFDPYADNL